MQIYHVCSWRSFIACMRRWSRWMLHSAIQSSIDLINARDSRLKIVILLGYPHKFSHACTALDIECLTFAPVETMPPNLSTCLQGLQYTKYTKDARRDGGSDGKWGRASEAGTEEGEDITLGAHLDSLQLFRCICNAIAERSGPGLPSLLGRSCQAAEVLHVYDPTLRVRSGPRQTAKSSTCTNV
jgi:hypothetical protein